MPVSAQRRARHPGYGEHLLRAAEQSLDDLARAGASELVLLRHARSDHAAAHLEALADRAWNAGFVTTSARVVADGAFDALDALVRAVARSATPGTLPLAKGHARPTVRARSRGLAGLLDVFVAAHPDDAPARFAEGCVREGCAGGDLSALAGAYVEAACGGKARGAKGRIDAWLDGTELARTEGDAVVVAALSPRTAKRALAELTRLVRALGFRGTLMAFTGADAVANLSPKRRDDAYTVLRELIDNTDGDRGLVATRVVVSASTSTFLGPRSMAELTPLVMRVAPPADAPPGAPPPHRPLVELGEPPGFVPRALPLVRHTELGREAALRSVVRFSQGLPAIDAGESMSVGHDRIERAIATLFELSALDGSVFGLISGAYGAGKTHFLMHLAARGLAERRPVFRLSIERLDADLGHPTRHLRRLLEHSMLPRPSRPSALDVLEEWTAPQHIERLVAALHTIAESGGEAARAAERALEGPGRAASPRAALRNYLGASELVDKSPTMQARRDAYARLLLWIALLESLEGASRPVLLIDEAENLFRGGATKAERRTALRSLSFYCGGALPGACVVLAVTPDALVELRAEAPSLLDDVAEQRTILAWEDAAMLCHRLKQARPIEVPTLDRAQRAELVARVRAMHEAARGSIEDPGFAGWATLAAGHAISPRELVRRTTDRLERLWWGGPDSDRPAPPSPFAPIPGRSRPIRG